VSTHLRESGSSLLKMRWTQCLMNPLAGTFATRGQTETGKLVLFFLFAADTLPKTRFSRETTLTHLNLGLHLSKLVRARDEAGDSRLSHRDSCLAVSLKSG